MITSRTRALAAPLAGTGAVAAASIVLQRTGGHDLGPLVTCWFHAGTGLHCPFCGSLRAVGALLHGDVLAAMHNNAPVIMLLGVAALIWGRRVRFAWGGRIVGQPRSGGRANVAIAVFFVVFAIYRNTSYGAWLAPLP